MSRFEQPSTKFTPYVQLEHAVDTYSELEKHVKLHNQSRFAHHRRVITEFIEHKEKNTPTPDLVSLCRAVSETRELASILRHLSGHEEFKKQVTTLIKGAALMHDDQNPLARSRQFELYVASRAMAANLAPKMVEPDLAIKHNGWNVSVAIKRTNSINSVPDRLSEAIRQIEKVDRPGFIFIDISRSFSEQDILVSEDSVENIEDQYEWVSNKILIPQVRKAVQIHDSPKLLGILVFVNLNSFDYIKYCPVDFCYRLFVPSGGATRKMAKRCSQITRKFYGDDGSLSSLKTSPVLVKMLQTIRGNI